MFINLTDVFYKFKDQTRNFSEKAANDIQGMLSLYEAAELRMHGEDILEEAHNFALVQLTKSLTTQLSPSKRRKKKIKGKKKILPACY